ncbi:hypothetical protein SOPP22_02235 [Shewanella sp. OPT22]|nr:hypothetical protein SOPP22_02235 [Shewanella sp. OPT22]
MSVGLTDVSLRHQDGSTERLDPKAELLSELNTIKSGKKDNSDNENRIDLFFLEHSGLDFSESVDGKNVFLQAAGKKSKEAILWLSTQSIMKDVTVKDSHQSSFLHYLATNSPGPGDSINKGSPFHPDNAQEIDAALVDLINQGLPLLDKNTHDQLPFIFLLEKCCDQFPEARALALSKVAEQLEEQGDDLFALKHRKAPVLEHLTSTEFSDKYSPEAFADLARAGKKTDLLSLAVVKALDQLPTPELRKEYQQAKLKADIKGIRTSSELSKAAFRAGKVGAMSYHAMNKDIRKSSVVTTHLPKLATQKQSQPNTTKPLQHELESHGSERKFSIVELPGEQWSDVDKFLSKQYINSKAHQLADSLRRRGYKWFHIPIKEEERGLVRHQQAMAMNRPAYAQGTDAHRHEFSPVLVPEQSTPRRHKEKVFEELPLDKSNCPKVSSQQSLCKKNTATDKNRNDFKRRQSLKRGLVTQMRAESQSISSSGTTLSFREELEKRRQSSLDNHIVAAFIPGSNVFSTSANSDSDSVLLSPTLPSTSPSYNWEARRKSSLFNSGCESSTPSYISMPLLMREDSMLDNDEAPLLPTITEDNEAIPEVQVNHIAEAIALTAAVPLGIGGTNEEAMKTLLLPALVEDEVKQYDELEQNDLKQLKEIQGIAGDINKAVKKCVAENQKSSAPTGGTLDKLNGVNDAFEPVMEEAPASIKTIVGLTSLVQQVKDLHGVVEEIEELEKGTTKVDDIITAGLGLAEGTLGAIDTTAGLFSELVKNESALKKGLEVAGSATSAITDITGAFSELYQLFKDIKDSDLTDAEATKETSGADQAKEYLSEGLKYGRSIAKIARQVAKAANAIIDVSGGEAVSGVVPGLGIAVHTLAIAEQLMHVSKDIQNYSKMAEIKLRLKEQFIGDGELEGIIDRDTFETNVEEAKRIAYESENDSSISQDAKDEAKRYLAVRYLKNVCEKRLHRAGIKTFVEFARLASAISGATGVGAEASVGLKAAGESISLAAYVVRKVKQEGHDFLEDGKSRPHKADERALHIKTLVGMLGMINEENPAEMIRAQLNEMKVMFKTAGLKLEEFTDPKLSAEDRIKKLDSALKKRNYL